MHLLSYHDHQALYRAYLLPNVRIFCCVTAAVQCRNRDLVLTVRGTMKYVDLVYV